MMVVIEGRGRVAPAPVKIVMDDGTMRTCLEIARRLSAKYARRKDEWGRGLLPKIVIQGVGVIEPHEHSTFAGKMGEAAAIVFLNRRAGLSLSIDDKIRATGDGGSDISPMGIAVQVKTSTSETGRNLVKVRSPSGVPIGVCGEVHIFAHWIDRTVSLRGWCKSAFIRSLPEVDAIRGSHKNADVAAEDLMPMCRLVDGLESIRLRRESQQ